ncbi:MAG: MBL fold metallo-hydrolase [bacterium]
MQFLDTMTLGRAPVTAIFAAALCFSSTDSAVAQAHDAGARMERLGDGVYAIIHDDATDEWVNGNTGVIVGSDGVLVVDATYLPSRARADIALIRTVTDKPVRYLVLTHLHRDHNGGASAYRDAFPGVSVVSGADTREFISINRAATARASAAPSSPLRAILEKLEAGLAKGTDTSGHPLTPAGKAALERNIRERHVELEDLSTMRVITPDVAVPHELDLYLGDRRVEVRNRGRAHSPDDVTVYLPAERVLFSGDIVAQGRFLFAATAWPVEWVRTLRELEATDIASLVPGHGPVFHDLAYTHAVRALYEGVIAQVGAMLKQGLTLEQVQQRIDTKSLRAASPAWAGPEKDGDWKLSIQFLVTRTWHELRGLD